MNLHKNPEEFYDTLLVLGDRLNTSPTIIEKDYYVRIYYKDYEAITKKVLFDPTSYETSITALHTIITSGVFEK